MFPPMGPLNVREAALHEADAIGAVHVAAWRETYRGLIPDAILETLDTAARVRYWRSILEDASSPVRIFVAESDEGVVGFSCGGPERTGRTDYTSDLYAIYVLQRAHGRGLGRRLFEAVTEYLRGTGHRSMIVWVLERNPACGFYQAMGGKRVGTKV